MKLLKITGILFTLTLFLSTFGTKAESVWSFVGTTIPGHSQKYYTSNHSKTIESPQYFKNIRAYDNVLWVERNLDVQLQNRSINVNSSIEELDTGEMATFSDSSFKQIGSYRLMLRSANPLSNDLYFNATWYLDNTVSRD